LSSGVEVRMQNPKTWRELLGHIIEDPVERNRIASVLEVTPFTLIRWVKSDSMKPRPQNLHRLLLALPAYRDTLLELLPDDLALSIQNDTFDDSEKEISPEFYARVFHDLSNVPASMRFQAIHQLILQQASEQLDPRHQGIAIIIVRCMPQWNDGKIHSLREGFGIGTSPWERNLESKSLFLGAESMAGYVATQGRPLVLQNLDGNHGMFPAKQTEYEKSAAVYPILRSDHIAGCFLVSSTQFDFFTPTRLELIQCYAHLIGLAFEPAEFYTLQSMELWHMPSSTVQRTYFTKFRQRVATKLNQATGLQQSMNLVQAEQIVWREMEEELLQLS
jgi:GAF domain